MLFKVRQGLPLNAWPLVIWSTTERDTVDLRLSRYGAFLSRDHGLRPAAVKAPQRLLSEDHRDHGSNPRLRGAPRHDGGHLHLTSTTTEPLRPWEIGGAGGIGNVQMKPVHSTRNGSLPVSRNVPPVDRRASGTKIIGRRQNRLQMPSDGGQPRQRNESNDEALG